jgi:hypothetical protein
MHDRDNPEGLFIRRVGYEIIPRRRETHGPRRQVGAAVALMGKGTRASMVALIASITRSAAFKTVVGYEFPNRVKVNFGFRMKIVANRKSWPIMDARLCGRRSWPGASQKLHRRERASLCRFPDRRSTGQACLA